MVRTTDAGNQVYCDVNGSSNEITTYTRYFSVHVPNKADSHGLFKLY